MWRVGLVGPAQRLLDFLVSGSNQGKGRAPAVCPSPHKRAVRRPWLGETAREHALGELADHHARPRLYLGAERGGPCIVVVREPRHGSRGLGIEVTASFRVRCGSAGQVLRSTWILRWLDSPRLRRDPARQVRIQADAVTIRGASER
jgi:hypothetical protein